MPTSARVAVVPLVAAAVAASGAIAPAAAAGPPRSLSVPRTVAPLVSVDAGTGTPDGAWSADDGYVDGRVTAPLDVPATPGEAPPAVTRTSRTGTHFSYTVRDLEPGVGYTLRLHFVEDAVSGPGERLMNVDVNGERALSDLDVFAAAGGRARPVHRDVPVRADASGQVVARFEGTKANAILAGLQVIGLTPPTRLGSYLQLENVRATATGPTSTVVRWKPVPGIAQYAVLRDGKIVGRTRDAAFVDGSAVAGRTYRYTAAAIDPDGTLGLLRRPTSVQMPSATARATGRFHVEGNRIIDPQGKVFVPVGTNLGSRYTFDGAGPAAGHAAEAKAWGWNTVRILVKPEWWDGDALRDLVEEYRAAGLVVMLDAHSYWQPHDPQDAWKRDRVKQMWATLAPEYAGDSGVWFNVANEPGYLNTAWTEFHDELLTTVRDAGAQNVVVVDAPTWGQDIGTYGDWFVGARHAYEAPMAPSLAARYGNVVLGQHNYGARYTTESSYGAYVDAVQRNGLPLVSNEFGYTHDGSTTAGSYELNRMGAKAVFAVNPAKGVGTIPWNGNVGDAYTLKQDRSPFYAGGAGAGLSELGRDLWALTH